MKKNILIFGAGGMLGRVLCKRLKDKYKVIPLARQDCDITDKKKVETCFRDFKPWVVINSAAYCDVDGCEQNKKKAYSVNASGAANIARAARALGSVLIHISTDYVFDGTKNRPYREADKPKPLSVYGKSKLKGEEYVRRRLENYLIIRSCWLFGRGRRNFVDDMLGRVKNKKDFAIVSDKFATPTYVVDLAQAISKLLDLISGPKWKKSYFGIYHITNSGFCSWYDYAKAIFRLAKIKGVRIEPIPMRQLKFIASRPAFSVLDNNKYIRLASRPLRAWQKAVKEYVQCG